MAIQTANNKYIGARYVPLIMGEWNATIKYEPLSVVLYQGNSYTSKTFVPIGMLPTTTRYWALTGNYNAQVELYRQEVETISNNLKKKIEIVDKVSSMKETNFSVGQVVKTLGFYKISDGGGADYLISDALLVPNDSNIIALDNGLNALLLVNGEVNFKQLGGKSLQSCGIVVDNSPFMKAFDDLIRPLGVSLYIPSGIWSFSAYTFVEPMIIRGEYMFNRTGNGSLNGTIITAFANGQSHVWKLSDANGSVTGTPKILTCFNVDNLIFSNAIYQLNGEDYIIIGYNTVTNVTLAIQGAEFGKMENIAFHYNNGTCLSVESCNEVVFKNFSFRQKSNPDRPVMRLQKHNTRNVNSALLFDYIQFEACTGHLIQIQDYLTNNVFSNIMFEPNTSPDSTGKIDVTTPSFDSENCIHHAIFEILSSAYIFGTAFNNILTDNMASYATVINSQQYIYDVIFSGDCRAQLCFTIDNILVDFIKKDFYLVKGNNLGGSASEMNFGRLQYNWTIATKCKPLIDCRYLGKYSYIDCRKRMTNVHYANEVYQPTLGNENAEVALLSNYHAVAQTSLSPLKTVIRGVSENSPIPPKTTKLVCELNETVEHVKFRLCQTKDPIAKLYVSGLKDGVLKEEEIIITSSLPNFTWYWYDLTGVNLDYDTGSINIGFSIAGDNFIFLDAVKYN